MSKLEVNLDLVQKYNVPGPRYTSYPPATRFTKDIGWPVLVEHVRRNNKTERDLSLYFHLPFCQSLCWFCGCTTVITKQQGQSAIYLEHIKKELALLKPLLNPRRKVVQLHFGGGSPTFLLPKEIRELGEMIRNQFQMADHLEAGVEIDPRGVTRDHIDAFREAGFNRASIGVQDFDPVVQKAVHRDQPRELTEAVVEWVRAAGFSSVNFDLIYGLPHQTAASFEKTLNGILALKPDRLVTFSYAHVPWLKPAQRILIKTLPTTEVKFQLLKLTIEKLTSEGYAYIGMDHFARNDDELAVAQRQKTLQRNFQGYSTHGGADIYAFGMSSISQTDCVYWQNLKELPEYYAALDNGQSPQVKGYILTDDDKIRRQTIMRIMCDLSVNYEAMSRLLGVDFCRYFERELAGMADLEADGLIQRNSSGLEVTTVGRLLIRIIAMRFDACLENEKERRFSKTI
jgi:oxygen-independent coproporphyrinogen III oxidase